MFAEAATSETAGAFTDATMHATGVKHVLQAGVFDEADGASMSSGKAGGPIRATVCLFGTFVSDFRIDFRFRRYKSTLVSGFDFRIGLSFPKVEKKYFRFPFLSHPLFSNVLRKLFKRNYWARAKTFRVLPS